MDPLDEADAVVATDVGHPLPDLGGPHSEAERLVKHASPARLAARLLLTILLLGGATLGARLARAAWLARYESEDAFPMTAPVASFPAGRSPFGLHDMEGNVREWTASPYCAYPATSCGNEMEYVIRGAGWSNHFEMNVEVTTREAIGKTEALEQLGFRCAR